MADSTSSELDLVAFRFDRAALLAGVFLGAERWTPPRQTARPGMSLRRHMSRFRSCPSWSAVRYRPSRQICVSLHARGARQSSDGAEALRPRGAL